MKEVLALLHCICMYMYTHILEWRFLVSVSGANWPPHSCDGWPYLFLDALVDLAVNLTSIESRFI